MENNIENEQFHTEIGLNTAFLHGVAGSQFPISEAVKPFQVSSMPGWSSVGWGAGFKPVGGESRSGSIPPHRRNIFLMQGFSIAQCVRSFPIFEYRLVRSAWLSSIAKKRIVRSDRQRNTAWPQIFSWDIEDQQVFLPLFRVSAG